VTRLAGALTVCKIETSPARSNRYDVVGFSRASKAVAELRNPAKRVLLEHERSPALVSHIVAASVRCSAFLIALKPVCAAEMRMLGTTLAPIAGP
jgi:hypothetical protein